MVFEEVCLEIRERDPEKSSKCIRQVFVLGTCAGQTDTSLALAEVTLQCRHAHGMVSAAERGQRGRVWGNSFAHSAREKAPCGLSQGLKTAARGAGRRGERPRAGESGHGPAVGGARAAGQSEGQQHAGAGGTQKEGRRMAARAQAPGVGPRPGPWHLLRELTFLASEMGSQRRPSICTTGGQEGGCRKTS